jgi:tetratricopeptide (TPR) repeat protein
MSRRTIGNDHPDLARALDTLGYSIRHIGWTDESKAPYREAFFIRRKILGAEHPDLIVSLLRYIGGVRAATADETEIALVRDIVAEQREKLPGKSLLRAPALFAYAALLNRPDRDPARGAELVSEANALLDEAIAAGVPLDVKIADAMSLHGWWKFLDGDAAEGTAMCEAGLRATRAIYGNRPGPLIQANHILGWVYFCDGRFEDAANQFAETIRFIRAVRSKRHIFLGLDLAGFAEACRKSGRSAEAREMITAAVEEWKWCRDPEVPFPVSAPTAIFALGMLMNDEGRFAEAEHAFREALRGFDSGTPHTVGLRVIPRGRVESGLGVAIAGQGRFEEAETFLLSAHRDLVERRPSFAGDGDAIVREARDAIAAFYRSRGMTTEAAQWETAVTAPGVEAQL